MQRQREGPKEQKNIAAFLVCTYQVDLHHMPSLLPTARSRQSTHPSIGSTTLPLGGLLVQGVRQAALATIVAVLVGGHEDASAAHLVWTLAAEALHLAVI